MHFWFIISLISIQVYLRPSVNISWQYIRRKSNKHLKLKLILLSPELLNNEPYRTEVDLWALGCCLVEMMARTYAFPTTRFVILLINAIIWKYGYTNRYDSETFQFYFLLFLIQNISWLPKIILFIYFLIFNVIFCVEIIPICLWNDTFELFDTRSSRPKIPNDHPNRI